MPYFNSAHDAQTERFMRGFGALGSGLGTFAGNLLKPETPEEKLLKAEEARRVADEKRRVEQDALRKQLGALMAEEPNIPGMTPPTPIPGTANIPMDAMVKPRPVGPTLSVVPQAPPPAWTPPPPEVLRGMGLEGAPEGLVRMATGGPPMGFTPPPPPPPQFREEPAPPSLEVPQPKGLMQTAEVPVPGMGPDPRIDNLKKQRAILGQLGQFGDARTVGERIEGLQVDDPPGLVRAEMAMIRPDMSKDDLRELLKSVKTMAVRGIIANRIDKLRGEEREDTKGTKEFERKKQLEEIEQKGATERTRMGEEGANLRNRETVEGRSEVAGAKPGKPVITLDAFIENERKKLNRAVEVARARLRRVTDEKFGGPREGVDPAQFQKFEEAVATAEDAELAFDDDAASAAWEKRYGGGAPAPKPTPKAPAPAPSPTPEAPATPAVPVDNDIKAQGAALVKKYGSREAAMASPEGQALLNAAKSKSLEVGTPADEGPPLAGGQVDPNAARKSAGTAKFRAKALADAGLTEEMRRARYEAILNGEGQYARNTPEEREQIVGRMAAEDDQKEAAIIRRYSGKPDEDEVARVAAREKAAAAEASAEAKRKADAEAARKKRLGSAANFLGR